MLKTIASKFNHKLVLSTTSIEHLTGLPEVLKAIIKLIDYVATPFNYTIVAEREHVEGEEYLSRVTKEYSFELEALLRLMSMHTC